MAHFHGTVRGQGEAKVSRVGSRNSGLETIAASHQGTIQVELYEIDGIDYADIRLAKHEGQGIKKLIYRGPIGGSAKK